METELAEAARAMEEALNAYVVATMAPNWESRNSVETNLFKNVIRSCQAVYSLIEDMP